MAKWVKCGRRKSPAVLWPKASKAIFFLDYFCCLRAIHRTQRPGVIMQQGFLLWLRIRHFSPPSREEKLVLRDAGLALQKKGCQHRISLNLTAMGAALPLKIHMLKSSPSISEVALLLCFLIADVTWPAVPLIMSHHASLILKLWAKISHAFLSLLLVRYLVTAMKR